MTGSGPQIVYGLCLLASTTCAVLLSRAWWTSRQPLLFWSAICFALLALNNLFVVLDMVIFADIDFTLARQISALAAVATLLYGFVWESER